MNLDESVREIPIYKLRQGYGPRQFPLDEATEICGYALVDAEDYDRCMEFKWYQSSTKQKIVKARIDRQNIPLSRLIMMPADDKQVIFLNHNEKDYRKCNLRVASYAETGYHKRKKSIGSSKFKGVSWKKHNRKWGGHIVKDGNYEFLGLFEDEVSAARAYNEAAKEAYGEFACLNEIPADKI